MRRIHLFLVFSLAASSAFCSSVSNRAAAEINRILQDGKYSEKPLLSVGERLHSPTLVAEFYGRREFLPVWNPDNGVSVATIELLNALQKADREGLNPEEYHIAILSKIGSEISYDAQKKRPLSPLKLAHFDLLLTDAFLTYGRHLLVGRINPDEIEDDWRARQRTGDLLLILEEGFNSGNIRTSLKNLHPSHAMYERLRIAFDRYRALEKAGGWDEIPSGPAVKVGVKDPRIPALRQRLIVEGDINLKPSDKTLFDKALERGLKNFQKRHGLEADGILGRETVAFLNIPVSKKVHQIEVNMERCRWLPADLGPKYIAVNVADFSLRIMEENEPVLAMKVVAGRKVRRTPVFSSTMTYVVFNPVWGVPVKIARSDILDHIREEPDYLIKEGFKVYASYEDNAPEVDPTTIDWTTIEASTLPYRFRQNPGAKNALGRIKFMFPNEFDVYLHDTPSKSLFNKAVRNFSSGCIRVEKPVELATFLLHSNEGWTQERIMEVIKTDREQVVILKEPIPVHLMYWTAWVDDRGKVQFRDDVYDRDILLDAALHRPMEMP